MEDTIEDTKSRMLRTFFLPDIAYGFEIESIIFKFVH